MSDETDRAKRFRGNTDHDPKPEFASRRNVLARGLAAPTPSGPGGMGGSGARSPARPDAPRDPQSFQPPRPAPPRDAPIAPPNPGDKERPFKRRMEGRDTKERETGGKPDQPNPEKSARPEFQRFATRDPHDRSR